MSWKLAKHYILGVPQKAERSIFVTLISENIAYFDSITQNIVYWKEWYQDHLNWFGSIDSTIISWNTGIYEFLLNMRELFTAGII